MYQSAPAEISGFLEARRLAQAEAEASRELAKQQAKIVVAGITEKVHGEQAASRALTKQEASIVVAGLREKVQAHGGEDVSQIQGPMGGGSKGVGPRFPQ